MKKKINEMSPPEQEQQRKLWRESQQKARAEKNREQIPFADDWTWNWSEQFLKQRQELDQYEAEFAQKLSADFGETFTVYSPQAETICWVATTLYCVRKNCVPWIQQVQGPNGLIAGGLFYVEVLASEIVQSVHRYDLEKSPTFARAYRELLDVLDRRFGHVVTEDHYEAKCIADVKAEIAGTYVPPERDYDATEVARSSRNERSNK